jgi:Uma2 family endonuclease
MELEEEEMASQNHAVTQLRLGAQLFSLGESYTAATELSLDMSTPERLAILEKYGLNETRELKPDLVLYQSKDLGFISPDKGEDKPRVQKVPLLCVEIVSPTQGSTEILKKIRVYFELGVQSCWYVDPALTLIRVYEGHLTGGKAFVDGELSDDRLGVKIPLNKVFF